MTKSVQLLLILSSIFITFLRPQAPPLDEFERKAVYYSTFKSMECKSFDPNVTGYFRNCFIKAYSRNYVTLNFGYKLHKPMTKPFHFQFIMSFRYGTIYREVINLKSEYCEMMETAKSNKVFQNMIITFVQTAPGLFHKCPYKDEADFFNISLDESKSRNIVMIPEGFYKICIFISKPVDVRLLRLCLVFYTKSPKKESFG